MARLLAVLGGLGRGIGLAGRWFWGVAGDGILRFLAWLGATLVRAGVVIAAGWLIYLFAQSMDWEPVVALTSMIIFLVICIGMPLAIMAKGNVTEAGKEGKKISEKLADKAWTAMWRGIGLIVLWVLGIPHR